MALDSAFWNDERELLLQFVLPFLRQSALNGAENGTRSLLDLAGVGVDWGLVNVDVHEWTLR